MTEGFNGVPVPSLIYLVASGPIWENMVHDASSEGLCSYSIPRPLRHRGGGFSQPAGFEPSGDQLVTRYDSGLRVCLNWVFG